MVTPGAAVGASAAGGLLALPVLAAHPVADARPAAYAPDRAALRRDNGNSTAEAARVETQERVDAGKPPGCGEPSTPALPFKFDCFKDPK
jgi:hypothetical protein